MRRDFWTCDGCPKRTEDLDSTYGWLEFPQFKCTIGRHKDRRPRSLRFDTTRFQEGWHFCSLECFGKFLKKQAADYGVDFDPLKKQTEPGATDG